MKQTIYLFFFFNLLIISCKNEKKKDTCRCLLVQEIEVCSPEWKIYKYHITYKDGKRDIIDVKAANEEKALLRCQEQCPTENDDCK